MALGDPYASVADLVLRLGRADDGTFADKLDTASRDVEQFCHRQFNTDDVATARTYRPLDGGLVIVDDFHTTTDLVVATDDDDDGSFETTWAATDFEVGPTAGVVSGAIGWPFWTITAATAGKWFRCGRRSTVQVTAQWGWAAVPSGIKEATLAVAEQVSGKSSGTVRSEAIDGYSVSFAIGDDVEVLGPFAKAAPYRRHEGFA